MSEYDFSWFNEEAKEVVYGTIDVQFKVHKKRIVLGTITNIKKQRSLQDTQKDKGELIE